MVPRIAVLKTCPRDEQGFYNFSLAAFWHRAIVERASRDRRPAAHRRRPRRRAAHHRKIEDGSCPQVGIGAMGVHSGMLTDGIVDLYRAGVVTGARKTLHPGKVVCTFGVGTKLMYDTADRNPDFLCHAVDLINPPHDVRRHRVRDREPQGQIHSRASQSLIRGDLLTGAPAIAGRCSLTSP
jgi:hypothetical protein